MQVFTSSAAARIDRVQEIGVPRTDLATVWVSRRVEPDPFVNIFGVNILRSELVRFGIFALE